MIGSFWNLCRACPSMPVDKLHSEYRSTYRWHEYTGPRQEVVRRPPQPSGGNASSGNAVMNQGSEEEPPSHVQDGSGSPSAAVGSNLEPALPRRKKHPELAYKTHEFLAMSDGGSDDSLESTVSFDRARSEERTGRRFRPSRRSKSEGPPTRDFPFQSEYRLQYGKLLAERQAQLASTGLHNGHKNNDHDWEEEMMTASFPPPPAPSGTMTNKTRISTEYRLQFAWPRPSDILMRKVEAAGSVSSAAGGGPPRKSLSMGAIRPAISNLVPVHHHHRMKRTEDVEGASELEPLVGSDDTVDGGGGEEKIQEESLSKEEKPRRRKEFKTEYKKRFRPFSQYEYAEGRFTKKKDDVIPTPVPEVPVPLPADYTPQAGDSWYHEVLELRKKAGEYKHRGWGTELVPQHIAELYNKQMALWEQVSRRSSLSALSLASTSPRSITKEEKEKENSKKSSPTKSLLSSRMGRAIEERLEMERKKADKDNEKKEVPRSRKEFLIRHHLERTTGAVDGALLPSPTREKLEPVILRRKDEEITIKSPSKSSPKSSPRSARSQSVGPISENRSSPKRQPRAPSVTPAASSKPQNGPSERRPRPSETLISIGGSEFSVADRSCSRLQKSPTRQQRVMSHNSTASPSLSTAPSRPKSSCVAMRNEEVKSSQHHAMKPKHNLPATGKSIVNPPGKVIKGDKIKNVPEKKNDTSDDNVDGGQDLPAVHTQKPTPPSTEPVLIEECEPIVKSPPEPTRVKSPEQILIRSPEPVNWTVPLDTGKTFTVTQNVRDGELSRPHSETKQLGTPSTDQEVGEKAAVASAGTTLHEEEPIVAGPSSSSDPMTTSMLGSFSTVNGLEAADHEVESSSTSQAPPVSYEKNVAGTTLKCLDDPNYIPINPSPYRVLEAPEISSSRPATNTPYRILEAPAAPTQSPSNPTLMSPNSSRTLASDVLEKARTRFDKFWGKSKDSDDQV